MKCKVCGKSSCGWGKYLDREYCNRECFENSEEFKKEKSYFETLLNKLDGEGIEILLQILERDSYLLNGYYSKWVEEKLKWK